MDSQIHNTNIASEAVITSPNDLSKKLPVTQTGKKNIIASRRVVSDILSGKDSRLMVIVGPCSIHNIESAKEYSHKLQTLSEELKESLYIVMRVYFEKPRTTIGWKGLISDPDMDNSLDVDKGLYQSRIFLTWLAVSIIFSPTLLDTSIVTEFFPFTLANDFLSSKVLFTLAISLKVITDSPSVFIGVFRTSSIVS